jgi:hypothetical protein
MGVGSFNNLLLQSIGIILTRLGIVYPWGKGIQDYPNGRGLPISKGR